ncbi:MAG: type II toxin-antitoxin system Phd/YefM family antitoxin [Alphaproteobacteria bacterium]|nr:type II toxin-antitoxin system Phd/YefM family antitoxin [Alphaproteobacteria bacterium]
MTRVASSAEVQKNFGAFREIALQEAVIVQHYGSPSVVIVSAEEYNRLRSFDRQVLALDDLTDQDLDDIAKAEIPGAYRYTSDQVPE